MVGKYGIPGLIIFVLAFLFIKPSPALPDRFGPYLPGARKPNAGTGAVNIRHILPSATVSLPPKMTGTARYIPLRSVSNLL